MKSDRCSKCRREGKFGAVTRSYGMGTPLGGTPNEYGAADPDPGDTNAELDMTEGQQQ